MTNKMHLPAGAEYIISRLCKCGFRADAVGGCVRDSLLGKLPSDYDIATSATPEEMKSVFCGERVIETGIKHGTLTVLLDGIPYEVTTYRIDGEYDDARHPRSVEFSRKIENDLSRRDFTVNAMAYNPEYGYTDLFGGREDLSRGIIRAVGVPEERFSEDALRILRALRFASSLDFEIEEETAAALVRLSPKLAIVSAERINVELKKLVAGKGAYRILTEYRSVIEGILPESAGYVLPSLERFSKASPVSRFLALLAHKSREDVSSAFHRLRSDNASRILAEQLIVNKNASLDSAYSAKRLLCEIGEGAARELVGFRSMLSLCSPDENKLLSSVLSSGECYKLSMLSVSGADISSLGVRGKAVGETLSRLLDAVMRGELPNERDALISCAVKNLG